MRIFTILATRAFTALLASSIAFLPALAKLNVISESAEIEAPPKYVFEAIKKERDGQSFHRKTLAYDGRTAKIDEQLENVPVYGKVHCIWEETEFPYEKIDYRMLESDKFKESYGSWLLKPAASRIETRLELKSFIDCNLSLPLADQITRKDTSESEKERLLRVKKTAEADYASDLHKAVRITTNSIAK